MQRLRTPERRDPLADVGSRLVFEFGGTFFLCLSYALVEPSSRPVSVACAVTALVYAGVMQRRVRRLVLSVLSLPRSFAFVSSLWRRWCAQVRM